MALLIADKSPETARSERRRRWVLTGFKKISHNLTSLLTTSQRNAKQVRKAL
jgi:hypothetical protein